MRKTTSRDVTGQRFGRLVAIRPTDERKGTSVVWEFICDCGSMITSYLAGVTNKNKTSCRKCSLTKMKEINTKHGHAGEKEYIAWVNMKRRCLDVENKRYKHYGGRGISICKDWINSFEAFLNDIGKMPDYDSRWSLERMDLNGNYCKENCKWIEMAKQARNKKKPVNNTSGHTGVNLDSNRYKARWRDLDGKLRCKSFSILKYGDEAFRLACEYRDLMINNLNSLGAGYGEHHGK